MTEIMNLHFAPQVKVHDQLHLFLIIITLMNRDLLGIYFY